MPVIDSDAHVLECEETWEYLDPAARQFRPTVVPVPLNSTRRDAWLIDGRIRGLKFSSITEQEQSQRSRQIGRNVARPQEAAEMRDVELRLKHMDELGIDIEVLHNTIFIETVAERPHVEVPICWAWNRWMADVWKQGKGRLRWTCVPPLLSMPDTLDVIRFAKEHGAVGVLLRAIEGNRVLTDPYFYPVYEEASRLDLAIAVHIANGNPWFNDLYNTPFEGTGGSFGRFMAPAVVFCHEVIMSQLPRLFPRLRWAVIEAGAQWLPWVISEAERRYQAEGRTWPGNVLQEYRIYVTCQTNNDMPFVVKYAGEDNLLVGTDYGHFDISSELDAITVFRRSSGLEERVLHKMVDANARAAWGL